MENNKYKTVEIKGTRFDVDMSIAKKIEEYRVGDKVKVLKKDYSEYKIYPRIIIGFDWFHTLPTITVAYLKIEYSTCEICFLHYNEKAEGIEISHSQCLELDIQPSDVVTTIDKQIESHTLKIEELNQRKNFFLKNFKKHFSELD